MGQFKFLVETNRVHLKKTMIKYIRDAKKEGIVYTQDELKEYVVNKYKELDRKDIEYTRINFSSGKFVDEGNFRIVLNDPVEPVEPVESV